MRRAFLVSITAALAAFALLPMPGHGADPQRQIRILKAKIHAKRAKEGVLTTTISGFNTRIRSLQGEIRGLRAGQNRIQESLVSKRAQLLATQNQLQKARDRLAKLKIYLGHAEQVLAERLVAMYKDGAPDALTVVLESNGFADLLERT